MRAASKCRALVGTLSASGTKLTLLLMLASHGTVPPFISLGGCVGHALETGLLETGPCRGDRRFLDESVDVISRAELRDRPTASRGRRRRRLSVGGRG